MWLVGSNPYKKKYENINDRLIAINRFSSDDESKTYFAEFLKQNIYWTFKILCGIDIFPYQEILIKAMMEKDFFLGILSRGLSKCIDENSYVLSEKQGFKQIKEVQIGEKIWARKGFQTVLNKWGNPDEDGLEITTSKGYKFKAKFGHKVLFYDDSNVICDYKNIENLKIGDILPIKPQTNNWGYFDLYKDYIEPVKTSNSPRFPCLVKNEPEFYYLLGLILGDGHISKQFVTLVSEDKEIINFISNKFKEYFPQNKNSIYNKERYCEIRSNNKNFINLLKHIGFEWKGGYKKPRLPPKLMNLSRIQAANLLRGIFDTDGWVCLQGGDSGFIGLGSCSKEFLEDIQLLLLNFGIVSSIRPSLKAGKIIINGKEYNKQNNYKLHITGQKNIILFNKNIGNLLKRKQDRISSIIDKNEETYWSNFIPNLGKYLKNLGYKGRFIYYDSMNLLRVKQLVEDNKLNEKERCKFKEILDDSFLYDKIISIQPCKTKTIDVTIENEECYWANGFIHHNSYSCGLFSVLYCLFNPGHKVMILSRVFRQSRQILKLIEELALGKRPEQKGIKHAGVILKKCIKHNKFSILTQKQDEWSIEFLNGSSILSIPLSDGQKARGQRADVVICDEFLTFEEKLVEEVIRPFLSTSSDSARKQKVIDIENELIKKGLMKEEDRTKFSGKKFIALSSASYTFDYLYKVYENYTKKIFPRDVEKIDDKDLWAKREASYGIMQMAYNAAPSAYFDKTFLEEAKSSMSDAQFAREMGAQFTQDSSGYYSARKFEAIKTNDVRVKVRGSKDKDYILAIDTQYAESENSDDFAMCILEVDYETRTSTLVHCYAVPGAPLSNHIEYLAYLLTNFNIIYVICDNTGGSGQFISSANESAVFSKLNLKIESFNADFENADYQLGLRNAKDDYKPNINKKVHLQYFSSQWLVKANQELQTNIDKHKIFLGGAMTDSEYQSAIRIDIPLGNFIFSAKDSLDENYSQRLIDFIDRQTDLIDLTVKECTLIEVKPTSNGGLSFDLPSNMRKSQSPNKPRKDSYTALLLANWAASCFFSMIELPNEEQQDFEIRSWEM